MNINDIIYRDMAACRAAEERRRAIRACVIRERAAAILRGIVWAGIIGLGIVAAVVAVRRHDELGIEDAISKMDAQAAEWAAGATSHDLINFTAQRCAKTNN